MSQIDYLIPLVSIIVGLGVADLIQSFRDLLRPDRVAPGLVGGGRVSARAADLVDRVRGRFDGSLRSGELVFLPCPLEVEVLGPY